MQSLRGEMNVRGELFDSWKPAARAEPYTCAMWRCDRTDGWVGLSSARRLHASLGELGEKQRHRSPASGRNRRSVLANHFPAAGISLQIANSALIAYTPSGVETNAESPQGVRCWLLPTRMRAKR
jgi:hypothetical protein